MASPLGDILRAPEPERQTIEEMGQRFAVMIREDEVGRRQRPASTERTAAARRGEGTGASLPPTR